VSLIRFAADATYDLSTAKYSVIYLRNQRRRMGVGAAVAPCRHAPTGGGDDTFWRSLSRQYMSAFDNETVQLKT